MRTFTSIITNRNGFGIGQDRVVVTARREQCAAAQHLSLWHASHCAGDYRDALKRAVAVVAGGAVRCAEQLRSAMSGPRLCRQPVRQLSPAGVDD
jgi:hypothetical protein